MTTPNKYTWKGFEAAIRAGDFERAEAIAKLSRRTHTRAHCMGVILQAKQMLSKGRSAE